MGKLMVQLCDGDYVILSTGNNVPLPLQLRGFHFAVSARLGAILATSDKSATTSLRINVRRILWDPAKDTSPRRDFHHGQILRPDDRSIGNLVDIGKITVISTVWPLMTTDRRERYERSKERLTELELTAAEDGPRPDSEQPIEVCLFQEQGRRLVAKLTRTELELRSEPCIESHTEGVSGYVNRDLEPIHSPLSQASSATPWQTQLIGILLPEASIKGSFVSAQVSVSTTNADGTEPGSCAGQVLSPLDKSVCLKVQKMEDCLQRQAAVAFGYASWLDMARIRGATEIWACQSDISYYLCARRLHDGGLSDAEDGALPPSYESTVYLVDPDFPTTVASVPVTSTDLRSGRSSEIVEFPEDMYETRKIYRLHASRFLLANDDISSLSQGVMRYQAIESEPFAEHTVYKATYSRSIMNDELGDWLFKHPTEEDFSEVDRCYGCEGKCDELNSYWKRSGRRPKITLFAAVPSDVER
ncbi:hypothetical protein PYCC9005_000826 [Savitreella phatthalungensis]